MIAAHYASASESNTAMLSQAKSILQISPASYWASNRDIRAFAGAALGRVAVQSLTLAIWQGTPNKPEIQKLQTNTQLPISMGRKTSVGLSCNARNFQ